MNYIIFINQSDERQLQLYNKQSNLTLDKCASTIYYRWVLKCDNIMQLTYI